VEQDLAAQLLTQALPLVRIHAAPMATWPERWRLPAMQQRRFRCRQPEMDPPQHIEVPAERQKKMRHPPNHRTWMSSWQDGES
jgi:hypothetical protein